MARKPSREKAPTVNILSFFKPIETTSSPQNDQTTSQQPALPNKVPITSQIAEAPQNHQAIHSSDVSSSSSSETSDIATPCSSTPQKPPTAVESKIASQATISTITASSADGLSEYERRRLERIEANRRFLEQLKLPQARLGNALASIATPSNASGIFFANPHSVATLSSSSTRPRRQDRKRLTDKPPVNPSRFSKRIREQKHPPASLNEVALKKRQKDVHQDTDYVKAVKLNKSLSQTHNQQAQALQQAERLDLNDASVLRYDCQQRNDKCVDSTPSEFGFRYDPHAIRLHSDATIYSMSVSTAHTQTNATEIVRFVATGGQQGFVSLYCFSDNALTTASHRQPESLAASQGFEPKLSFRAHNGWVSSVRFGFEKAPDVLATSANDGLVKLWRLSVEESGTSVKGQESILPVKATCIARSNTDLHRRGIFALDVMGDRVASCSKDSSVALTTVRDGEIKRVQHFSGHLGVVKSVAISPTSVTLLGSCGNDRTVRIFDGKSSASEVICIQDTHSNAINRVQWHPTDNNMLLSSGFDGIICLHDLRKPDNPLWRLQGHTVATTRMYFHPSFVSDGRFVATGGSAYPNQAIWLYDIGISGASDADHSPLAMKSRGALDQVVKDVLWDTVSRQVLVADNHFVRFMRMR